MDALLHNSVDDGLSFGQQVDGFERLGPHPVGRARLFDDLAQRRHRSLHTVGQRNVHASAPGVAAVFVPDV